MAEILFAGAAGEVTGSRHLLKINGKHILLDCGLFQGHRREAEAKNRAFAFDPAEVDAVVLSHAHLDHSGNLPSLLARGFRGRVFCTSATAELTQVLLEDSAHIQEKDAEFFNTKNPSHPIQPVYTVEQALACKGMYAPVELNQPFEPVPGVTARFFEAGHILGSAQVRLDWSEGGRKRSLFYTGDLGRKDMPLLRDPFHPRARPDILLIESTYGDRLHARLSGALDNLEAAVSETVARGGKILVPAFAVGRTQELLFNMDELHINGKLLKIPVFVDSPLAKRATDIFKRHLDLLTEPFQRMAARSDPFSASNVRFTESTLESKALNESTAPAVILAGSGMAESGRIQHHLGLHLPDPRCTVLIVGFQAEGTLGRHLLDGWKSVSIYGKAVEVKAEIRDLAEYSAHADQGDLMEFFKGMEAPPERLILVHGEDGPRAALAAKVRQELGWPSLMPRFGQREVF